MKSVTQKSRRLVISFLYVVLVVAVVGVGVLLGLQTFSSERERFVQEINQTALATRSRKTGLAVQNRLMDLKRHLKTLIANSGAADPLASAPPYWRKELLAVAVMERKKTQIAVSGHFANTALLKKRGWDRKLLSNVYQTHPLPLSKFFKSPGTDILNRSLSYSGRTGIERIPILTLLVEGKFLDPSWAGRVIAVDFLQDFLINEFQSAKNSTFFLIRRNGRLVSHPESEKVITYAKSQLPHPIVSRLQRGFSSAYSMSILMQGKRVICSIEKTQFRDVLAVSQMSLEQADLAVQLLMKRTARFAIPTATIVSGLLLGFFGFWFRRRRKKRNPSMTDVFEDDDDQEIPSPTPKEREAKSAKPKRNKADENATHEALEAEPASEATSGEEETTRAFEHPKDKNQSLAKNGNDKPKSKPLDVKPQPVEVNENTRLTQLAQTGNIDDIVRGTSVPRSENGLPHDLESAAAWIEKICAHLPKKGLLRKKFSPPTDPLDVPPNKTHHLGGGLEVWARTWDGEAKQDFFSFSKDAKGATVILGTVLGDGVSSEHKQEIAKAFQLGLDGDFKKHRLGADDILERLTDVVLQHGKGKIFTSVTVLEASSDGSEVTLHTAGHPPPIRMLGSPLSEMDDSADTEEVEYWTADGETLGTEPEPEFEGRHYELLAGDSLLVYSQGMFAARTRKKKNWDEETLATALMRFQGNKPENVYQEFGSLFEKALPKSPTNEATALIVTRNNTVEPATVETKRTPVAAPVEQKLDFGDPPEMAQPITEPAPGKEGSLAQAMAEEDPESERRQEFLYGDFIKKSA